MSSSFYCPLSQGKQYFTNFKVGRLCWKRKESGKLLSATIYPLTMGKRAKCGKTKRVLFLEELFLEKSRGWLFFHSEVYNHAKHSRRDESTWVTVKNGGKNTINVFMQCVTLSLHLLHLKKVPLLIFYFLWELHYTLLRLNIFHLHLSVLDIWIYLFSKLRWNLEN